MYSYDMVSFVYDFLAVSIFAYLCGLVTVTVSISPIREPLWTTFSRRFNRCQPLMFDGFIESMA